MVVECPSCNTKFAVDASLIANAVDARFHCSRCNHYFALPSDEKEIETEAQVEQPEPEVEDDVEMPLFTSPADVEADIEEDEEDIEESALEEEQLDTLEELDSSPEERPAIQEEMPTKAEQLDILSTTASTPTNDPQTARRSLFDQEETLPLVTAEWPSPSTDTQYEVNLGGIITPRLERTSAFISRKQAESSALDALESESVSKPEPTRSVSIPTTTAANEPPVAQASATVAATGLSTKITKPETKPAAIIDQPLDDFVMGLKPIVPSRTEPSRNSLAPSINSAPAASPPLAPSMPSPAPTSPKQADRSDESSIVTFPFRDEDDSPRPKTPLVKQWKLPIPTHFSVPPLVTIASVPLILCIGIAIWSRNIDSTPHWLSEMLSLQGSTSIFVPPPGLQVVDAASSIVIMEDGSRSLEVNGSILNATLATFEDIQIEAKLYNKANDEIRKLIVGHDNALVDAQVNTLTEDSLLRLQKERKEKPASVKPNAKVPFRLVFPNPAAETAWFSARIYSVGRANSEAA